MKTYFIQTFGCQMNFHDSEKIAGILDGERLSPTDDPVRADVVVINTCSIRHKAEHKFFSSLGRMKLLKTQRPGMKIVVTGCVAQQAGKRILRRAPYVDHVIGTQNISQITAALHGGPPVLVNENPGFELEELPTRRHHAVRASVTIMFGCNNFCSYCIVPYTRGRESSRPSEHIVREIRELAEKGYKDVTLLGQNVNSYRSDCDFPTLLERIDRIEGISRIRFMTSHPRDLSDRLISAMRDLDKVCEHLHLPLQSGSDRILSRMNRNYTFSEYLRRVDTLRSAVPGIALTTDIIAGFPSETDADHASTLKALRQIAYDGIFAFQYSPRPSTPAAAMVETLAPEEKSERLQEILQIQDMITVERNQSFVGTSLEGLCEDVTDSHSAIFRTRTNKIVNATFEGACPQVGTIAHLAITAASAHSLEGSLCP